MFNIVDRFLYQGYPAENCHRNLLAKWEKMDNMGDNCLNIIIWEDTDVVVGKSFIITGSMEDGKEFAINKLKEMNFDFFLWTQQNKL